MEANAICELDSCVTTTTQIFILVFSAPSILIRAANYRDRSRLFLSRKFPYRHRCLLKRIRGENLPRLPAECANEALQRERRLHRAAKQRDVRKNPLCEFQSWPTSALPRSQAAEPEKHTFWHLVPDREQQKLFAYPRRCV